MIIGDSLSVWSLANPKDPARIGVVSMVSTGRGLTFTYDKSWLENGYALSGDMPLQHGPVIPKNRDDGLGALNDAMPDRWGERAIRYLDNPKRVSPLDLLYLAGDRRFGSLGFSANLSSYQAHDKGPLPGLSSLESLQDLLYRIEHHEPLSETEKLLVSSTKTMGGAHPKALVIIDSIECIAKFPRGSNVDIALIEHASMVLASGAGINVSTTCAVATSSGHVVAVARFDRAKGRRLHCLSAKTALLCGVDSAIHPIAELSYPAMADFIRQFSSPDKQSIDRHELFRRMVFNILIENTDDHEKNHAFIFDGQYWSLAPAYDVLPLMANAGWHEMIIGSNGAEGTLENALSQCERFDLDRSAAQLEWARVAERVSHWKEVFATAGVTENDIRYLAEFIDFEDRVMMRQSEIHALKP